MSEIPGHSLAFSWIQLFSVFQDQFSHLYQSIDKKVQVGKDQENAQSEKDSHSKNQGGKKPN